MHTTLLKVEIKYEHDVVLARQRARQITQLLGFEGQDQVRIATAVSELARNAFQYAGGGRVEFILSTEGKQKFSIRITDKGPGIAALKEILNGQYVSKTGMGIGLVGAQRLMDDFSIESEPSKGTSILLTKNLPSKAPQVTGKILGDITESLIRQEAQSPFEEIQKQNQELLAALDEVQRQQALLTQLNQELEETNRGVLALSGELEQRADYQRRTSELKTEFLSTITHELRTPLNSIISISGMLLDRLDGELAPEQEKQVSFIQSSAKSLSELVNDVLDLAKVEAGKIIIRPRKFEVGEMFRILTGMLKPLMQTGKAVELIFEPPLNIPPLFTDEGKVSQILRNFISNSLKYTKLGEIRVSAELKGKDVVVISVSDTGLGIAPENHEMIFEEFLQVEGDHQQKVKGTGLGLPLSKKLAIVLGGEVRMQSTLGKGSTFSVALPVKYSGPQEAQYSHPYAKSSADRLDRILIIDDNPTDRYVLKKLLEVHTDDIIEASSGEEGLVLAQSIRPSLIFLDLSMPGQTGNQVLKKLKRRKDSKSIPVVIHTSKVLDEDEQSELLSDAVAILSKSSSQKLRAMELTRILHDIVMSEQQVRKHSNA